MIHGEALVSKALPTNLRSFVSQVIQATNSMKSRSF